MIVSAVEVSLRGGVGGGRGGGQIGLAVECGRVPSHVQIGSD